MDSSNPLAFSSATPIAENSNTHQSKIYNNLPAGFYTFQFLYNIQTPSTMYQSDPYLCPNT